MKRLILSTLIAVLSVSSMAAKCQPEFERKCEEKGGFVRSDPNSPEHQLCIKDGKEIDRR